jgi:ATPase subunit of ABC transporter with duplicated ATPase domains
MIEKVIIKDRKDLWSSYMCEVLQETEYNFTSGVNVIVGENGCGKSTLFTAIYNYMLANNGIYSSVPNSRLLFPTTGIMNNKIVPNGMEVKADYKSRLYRLIQFQDTCANEKMFNHDANLEMFATLQHTSKGEECHHGFYKMLDIMFRVGKEYDFIKELTDKKKQLDNNNDGFCDKFIQYYQENQIPWNGKVTMLLDEPDNNLDVINLKHLYDLLTFEHPEIQVIAIIHNVALIKKLLEAKDKGIIDINFIEMTPGYLKTVKEFLKL